MCLTRSEKKKTKYFFRNYRPCGTCYNLCEDQNSIPCSICNRFFHRKCKKLSKKAFENLKSNGRRSYICSEKCHISVLPYHNSDDVDFYSGIFGEGLYPCAKCKRDCVDQMACIQCSVCDAWCHHICSNLSNDEFLHKKYFYCGYRCENININFLPFNTFGDTELFKHEIFVKSKLVTKQKKKKKS